MTATHDADIANGALCAPVWGGLARAGGGTCAWRRCRRVWAACRAPVRQRVHRGEG
jgi:hypothetical protein